MLKRIKVHNPVTLAKRLAGDYMDKLITKVVRISHSADTSAEIRPKLFWLATGEKFHVSMCLKFTLMRSMSTDEVTCLISNQFFFFNCIEM